jgi:AbrB family looped-hinge helix DNA binding protein
MNYMILVINIKYVYATPITGDYMMGEHEFYGSTTVGERGQIVLPAKLRGDLGILAGDKLLVLSMGPPKARGVMIMKAEVLNEMVRKMSEHFQTLLEKANDR